MCNLKCEDISSYGQRNIFSWKLHIGMIWIFFDNYLFIKPENLKASLKISPLTFLREKVSTFAVSK